MNGASTLDPRTRGAPARAVHRTAIATAAAAVLCVTALVALGTSGWIGKTFPGFFVLPNRVIPSVGRVAWSGSNDASIYQRTVVAVDGARVASSADLYRAVAEHAPGTPVKYTLRDGSATESLELDTRAFSRTDYWLIFGSYLVTGVLYLLVGLAAAWLKPDASVGRALLALGAAGGIFALTGAGIYAPGADLRIHALAEAFFPATLIGFAASFVHERRKVMRPLVMIAWWLSFALAIPYQLLLGQPGAYSLVHAACETYLGVAGLAVGVTLLLERAREGRSAPPLLRAALAGALLGLGMPALVMVISGVSGGGLPVNVVTATAFLFPLCNAWGLASEQRAGRAVAAVATA